MTTPFYAGSSITAEALDTLAPQILVVESNVPIASTTPTPLMDATVAAATYLVEGLLECVIGGTATAPMFRFDLSGGAAVTSMLVPYTMCSESNTGESVFGAHLTGTGPGNFSSTTAAFGGGDDVQVKFAGIIVFSAGGTLSVSAAESTGGDTYTVAQNSWMRVTQQVT
jgi:hypothetical protein